MAKKTKYKHVIARVPEDDYEVIREIAKRTNWSFETAHLYILQIGLEQHKKNQEEAAKNAIPYK